MSYPYEIYRTDGTFERINLAFPMNLERFQKEVGGYIEIMDMIDGRTMVANEEAYFLNLPVNPHFTDRYVEQKSIDGFIRGNIVIGYVR